MSYLQPDETTLLHRLPVDTTPVIQMGIKDIAQDLPEPLTLLQRLVALSLVDVETAPDLNNQRAYQISPLVAEWLQAQGVGAGLQREGVAGRYGHASVVSRRYRAGTGRPVRTAAAKAAQIHDWHRGSLADSRKSVMSKSVGIYVSGNTNKFQKVRSIRQRQVVVDHLVSYSTIFSTNQAFCKGFSLIPWDEMEGYPNAPLVFLLMVFKVFCMVSRSLIVESRSIIKQI